MKVKFKEFIENKIKNQTGSKQYLISFAFETNRIDKNKIIKIFNSAFDQFFYFDTSWKDFAFITSEPEYQIERNTESNSPSITSLKRKWAESLISNHDQFKGISFPIVVGASKFENIDKEGIWTDFSTHNWFIPKIAYICKCGKNYAIVNFVTTGSNLDDLCDEFEKRIQLLDFQNNNHFKNDLGLSEHDDEKPEDLESWKIKINAALNEINEGHITKVVVSRRVEKDLDEPASIQRLINKLKEDYKGCYIFAFKKYGSAFIGASPEKLLSFNQKLIETDALAGSIKRGQTDFEDSELELKLLNDPKNLREYSEVVKYVVNTIKPYSRNINYFEKPFIKKLTNIQHLWTPIKAEVNNVEVIDEIVKLLHPTPAICGTPREKALELITEIEDYPRGLFSGIIGWFNLNLSGEFAVAIRSALLKNKKLYAFAGCGIVEGSDPQDEFEETKLKLKPILSIFENEKIYQS